MKQGKTLEGLLQKIIEQDHEKQDYVISKHSTCMEADGTVTIKYGEQSRNLITTETFEQQMGSVLGIPRAYWRKMKEEQPMLLARNVNTWLQDGEGSHTVRTLGDMGRAYLSSSYRPIDNYEVAEYVLPTILDTQGLEVKSCEVTHENLYIKVVNARIQGEVRKGDIVQSGFYLGNNEVGGGSLVVQPLIYRLVCTNGMIAADKDFKGFSRRHVGGRNEDAWEVFSDETRHLTNEAILSQIKDMLDTLNDPARFAILVEAMQRAANKPITGDIIEVVNLTQRDYQLSKEEHKGVLENLLSEGDRTLYGLANAVTRTARDVESYDRATALENLGYSILTMPDRQWGRMQEEARLAA